MILVYSEEEVPRLKYTLRLLFGDVLQVRYELSTDKAAFKAYEGPKFSYAAVALDEEINFRPHGLLSQEGINEQEIEMMEWDGIPVFFKVPEGGSCPCDPLAVSFYLAVRYEEYLDTPKDEYGRFPSKESLACKAGFLDTPVVNLLALQIREMIIKRYPGAELPLPAYEFRPSIDIDIAYAHLEKGWLRAAGGFAKLMVKADFSALDERLRTLQGAIPDPYDNFDYQQKIFEEQGLRPLYFVLLGDWGKYDKNNSYRSARFRKLIWKLSERADIGIHPSYGSFNRPGQLRREIKRLQGITRKPVALSRQHFLRLGFPATYRTLLDNGITSDHSLGYSDCNGFRSGLCSVYNFYDLEKEEMTNLRLFPFVFMDTAMIDNMGYLPGKATEEALALLDKVKNTGGTAIGVWHNYALSETGHYAGWRESFENILEQAL